ncbi:cupredoxin domain-containing protein [Halomarina rubra]|uniref:Plastocyanin/azurin family copper-binding protein n=1 Tax=Halomarina rubra TaxID=2071873 RepID=A0ABD6ART9_9EURY|nr:plastocyanin/azurin family copper-binding protein [Halomarina rubra]
MKRRTFLATAAGAASVSLAGCSSILADSEYDVDMTHYAYEPDAIEVQVGETVLWGNSGSRGHTVTAYDDAIPDGATYFASGGFEDEQAARDAFVDRGAGNVAPGETYEHTFEVAGTYGYVCLPHEGRGMVGTVTVVEE